MTSFFQQHLFAVILAFSVALHAAAAYLGYSPIVPPKLKPVQTGRASISLRSTLSSGPKSGAEKKTEKVQAKPKPKPEPPKVERLKTPPRPEAPKVARPAPKKLVVEKPKEEKAKPPEKPKEKAQTTAKKVDVISDQENVASRGSLGSRGAGVDGDPVQSAYNPKPDYPPELLAARIEGTVMLLVKLDARGRVQDIRLQKSSGYEAFDRSALEAVRGWEFEPATRGGVPVPYEFLKPIDFVIKQR